jgi:hypothetical protein
MAQRTVPNRTHHAAVFAEAVDVQASSTSRDAALNALGGVLVDHLRKLQVVSSATTSGLHQPRPGEAAPPILINLDGPGGCDLLDRIAPELRTEGSNGGMPWTVVRFDAWQYQRVQPPWWWLVEAFDRQVRADLAPRGWAIRVRERLRRLVWQSARVARDPWVVALFFLLAISGGILLSLNDTSAALKTTATLAASLTTVGALLLAIVNAFRRQVLMSSRGQNAILRASDPMAAFQEHYAYLLGARSAPVAFLVENLDRCHAAYVVELLEGIQTLLKHRPRVSTRREAPLVAFLVAAEESWLCDSFVEVYAALREAGSQPGRPLGLAFLDRVFQYTLHLPTVPMMAPISNAAEAQCSTAGSKLKYAAQELEIRKIVRETEGMADELRRVPPPSVQRLRIDAVKQLGEIEDLLNERLCSDTTSQLIELTNYIDAAAEVVGQLRGAYCSQRTAQLLGGHEIDADEYAIYRLALWTVLALKWPLLTEHLVKHPDDIEYLRHDGDLPEHAEHLAAVFADSRARQVAIGFPGQAELIPEVVRRFSVPVPSPDPQLARPARLNIATKAWA